MKEATGELNMTVVTVVAITAVSAMFMAFVWPNIKSSIKFNQACSALDAKGNYDSGTDQNNNRIKCTDYKCIIYDEEGKQTNQRECPKSQ